MPSDINAILKLRILGSIYFVAFSFYTLSNFKIRRDVIAYLRRVTIKRACSIWNRGKILILWLLAVKYTIYHG